MAIPDFQSLMLPIMKLMHDKEARKSAVIRDEVAKEFHITESERNELLPSGTVSRFDNNVSWALSYLSMAKLLTKPARGIYCISERGQAVLSESVKRIDMKYLSKFPEYAEKRKRALHGSNQTAEVVENIPQHQTPEEMIGSGYEQIRETLSTTILEQVKQCSPRFFESLVVQLLIRMGYGGSLKEAGQVIGKSGDGGIDGIIKEDKLGLDVVYIQAKRWEGSVGRPVVQTFAGSLLGHGAKKGVLITTSQFSNDAREYVKATGDQKIVLIDGFELAQLMIDYDVGVSTIATYTVKKIDSDYFEEE